MAKTETIGIIGLGLIGGSIALSLKSKRQDIAIIACDRNTEELSRAQRDGAIDHHTKKLDETFSACDVIFICTPVSETIMIAERLKRFVSKNAVITDVGSTKSAVCGKMREYRGDFTFIGGHPMAGSERSGYSAARRYLFENAYHLLTPYDDTPSQALETLTRLAALTGAVPLIIPPETHDFVTGAISHLPQVVAAALVNSVFEVGEANAGVRDFILQLASGGFKDITRVASSSPVMWSGISEQNRVNILDMLKVFREKLEEYERCLVGGGEEAILPYFLRAKEYRDEFSAVRRYSDMDSLRVDLEDKPGGIAFVTAALAYRSINIKSVGIVQNRAFDGGILEIALENAADKLTAADILRANGLVVYE